LIYGRNVILSGNAGDTQEAPAYPYVVGITWDMRGNQQKCILELSDLRLSHDKA
jgi:hypothetical protein